MGGTPVGKGVNGNAAGAGNPDALAGYEPDMGRYPFLGLYLFVLALSADIVLLFVDMPVEARLATKPLIVVGLLWFFMRHAPAGMLKGWIVAALVLSWLGDGLLLFEERNSLFFLLGLGSFLLAHICYCVYFLHLWRREQLQLHLPFLIGVVVYYAGLVGLLAPGLGAMKAPVLVYGAVISAMFLLALHATRMRGRKAGRDLMLGALLFVVSDSLLAVNRFYTPFAFAGIAVMLTYGIAQWHLIKGALLYGGGRC